jgi:hypothetical protein
MVVCMYMCYSKLILTNNGNRVFVTASVTHAAVPHYQSSRKRETLSFYTFEHIR